MLCEVPLTKEQQAFATDHHGLVYKFLNENHLPEDEFYDVVVFAYLKAVKDYYTEKKADTEFVEMYDHFKIYTKSGKYKDTYVAFVRYDMKIKDIYTEVPGLGTLYVKKDSQGNYQITQQVKKKEIREYINRIAEHEDVQALMNQTHESYQKAVGSDALLKEALDELKDAYENSIGN